jgi:hypothetical protein
MHHIPRVAYVASSEMAENAAYDSHSQTIYLPVGWNGSSPAELSVFVREIVHHLQSEAGPDYRCGPEQLANVAQSHWLAIFESGAQQVNATGASRITSNPRCIFQQNRVEN